MKHLVTQCLSRHVTQELCYEIASQLKKLTGTFFENCPFLFHVRHLNFNTARRINESTPLGLMICFMSCFDQASVLSLLQLAFLRLLEVTEGKLESLPYRHGNLIWQSHSIHSKHVTVMVVCFSIFSDISKHSFVLWILCDVRYVSDVVITDHNLWPRINEFNSFHGHW